MIDHKGNILAIGSNPENLPQHRRHLHRNLRLLPIAAVLLAALSGCAIVPQPLADSEVKDRVQQDLHTLFKDVEPINGELSLHEAFARALKYNYDYRLRAMEQTMASAQLDLSKFDLLPRLTVSAGYDARSNDSGSRSVDLGSGVENRTFTGGQDRRRNTENAVLAWNILDFGVSYVRAEQQANQVLISEERKRKVVQNISQDVRQAFWRAYGAQKALPRLEDLLNRVKEATVRSQRLETDRLMPPLQALAFQRALLDLHQQIVIRRQDLVLAQTELAALINLRPGTPMTLTSNGQEQDAVHLQPLDDLDALDQAALSSRPELREEDYRKKISVLEARRAMLALLPGIDLNFSTNHDSNKFLFHNSWSEATSTISFNLLRAFSYPAQKRAQEAQSQLDDTRRIALGMAVLTQVRLAARHYQEAHDDYLVNVQGAEIDSRIEGNIRAATKASAESEMELLRAEVKSALSDMQRYIALANLQTAYARVANSVGADLLPAVPQTADLKVFSNQLAEADLTWRKTSFHINAVELPKPPVAIGAIEAPTGSKLDLAALLRTRLTEQGALVVAADGAQTTVVTGKSSVGEVRAGVRAVELIWTVQRGTQVLGTVPYRSVISDSVPNSWAIFGASAAESSAAKIASLLKADAAQTARQNAASVVKKENQ
jgi:outer membrane protein TolC